MKLTKLSLFVLASSLLVSSMQAGIKDSSETFFKGAGKYALTAGKGVGSGLVAFSTVTAALLLCFAYKEHPKWVNLGLASSIPCCGYTTYKLGRSFLQDLAVLRKTIK